MAGYAIMIATVGVHASMLTSLWWPALTIGVAIWTARNAKRRRATLTRVFRDGQLRFARLEECIQVPVGRGMAKRTFNDHISLGSGTDRIDLYYFCRGHTTGDAWARPDC